MEQVTGFEPVSSAWQAEILAIILYLHKTRGPVGEVSVHLTTRVWSGADSPIRTDVDFRLVVTNHVQSATMRYRQVKSSVSSFNLTHPRWSYTTLDTHNESCATLVRRSWPSECSIGEAGIVFTWLLMLVYELMDRDTGFEPAPSAWKAEMLAADTNPANGRG